MSTRILFQGGSAVNAALHSEKVFRFPAPAHLKVIREHLFACGETALPECPALAEGGFKRDGMQRPLLLTDAG